MTLSAEFTSAVSVGSTQLQELIDYIAAGAIERDERSELPYAAIAAVKRARLGALRLPVEDGGGGATLRQLYEVFIELAAADPNVPHSCGSTSASSRACSAARARRTSAGTKSYARP